MPTVVPLTMSLAIDAVIARSLKYTIDEDGDIKMVFGRDKGKDIFISISNPERTDGYLVLWSVVYRFFNVDQLAKLLMICNAWNRDRRMGRAFLSNPDRDEEFTVRFDHYVRCTSGTHVESVRDALSNFAAAAGQFWDELDDAT